MYFCGLSSIIKNFIILSTFSFTFPAYSKVSMKFLPFLFGTTVIPLLFLFLSSSKWLVLLLDIFEFELLFSNLLLLLFELLFFSPLFN